MDESIASLQSLLEDREGGWVQRRDAAEALGKLSYQAASSLVEHLEDADMDVRIAIERCLEPLHVMLRTRAKLRKHYTLRDLAYACERRGARAIETQDAGFVVSVKLKNGRSQRVHIMPHETRDGKSMVRIYTLCGPATAEKQAWALKANAKLTHGAFALMPWQGQEHLVIINNILKQEALPDVVKRCVKEMAQYGDWLEEKLSGLDEF